MIFYPVVIPTLNRYDHFKRCVESLARNTHADKTELVIGLDYPPSEKYREGYEKIKNYILSITGFKKVIIFEREENYGAVKNTEELIAYVYKTYDAVIFTEDDNEFSPCFLDYMNKGLERFADDELVTRISGYNFIEMYNQGGRSAYFRPVSSAWGVGEWRKKAKTFEPMFSIDYCKNVLGSLRKSWRVFSTNVTDLSLTISMVGKNVVWGDVAHCLINILNDKYELAPATSLVRNMGHDGTGEHCGAEKDNQYSIQPISNEIFFDLGEINQFKSLRNRWKMFITGMPSGFLRVSYYILRTWYSYFRYRITSK